MLYKVNGVFGVTHLSRHCASWQSFASQFKSSVTWFCTVSIVCFFSFFS